MKSLKTALAAALLSGIAAPAFAADLAPIVVPGPADFPAPPVAASGFYLRGDIGFTMQEVDRIDNELFATAETLDFLEEGEFETSAVAGLGLGYQFNDFFRMDVTGEYRADSDFHALDRYDADGDGFFDGTNEYYARKSEVLALANAYVDLGYLGGFSPYIGAGIGAVRIDIDDYRDVNVPTGGVAYAADVDAQTNFAWALHAGLGFDVSSNVSLDLGYRYVDMGDFETGDVITYTEVSTVDNPTTFEDITSHDVRIGVRYLFNAPEMVEVVTDAPVMAKY